MPHQSTRHAGPHRLPSPHRPPPAAPTPAPPGPAPPPVPHRRHRRRRPTRTAAASARPCFSVGVNWLPLQLPHRDGATASKGPVPPGTFYAHGEPPARLPPLLLFPRLARRLAGRRVPAPCYGSPREPSSRLPSLPTPTLARPAAGGAGSERLQERQALPCSHAGSRRGATRPGGGTATTPFPPDDIIPRPGSRREAAGSEPLGSCRRAAPFLFPLNPSPSLPPHRREDEAYRRRRGGEFANVLHAGGEGRVGGEEADEGSGGGDDGEEGVARNPASTARWRAD